MPILPLAGPSGHVRGQAEPRRTINWMPVQIESGTGKAGARSYLKQCAGLKYLANVGSLRGLKVANNRLFAVTNTSLLEVSSSWSTTTRGSVGAGDVEMAANETQLGIVTGPAFSVFDLDSNAITTVTANFTGSNVIDTLDGYGVLAEPGTETFYLTANQDFTSLSALTYASAESRPGAIVSAAVRHRELVILKETSGEFWYDAGNTDFPFARNDSASIEVGCAAQKTLRKLNGVLYWLGKDEQGSAVVFGMPGYAPQRVSSQALEEQLQTVSDLSTATAWTYHQEGLSFYVLNVPGLETTWVYEVAAGIWHERGEWSGAAWSQWRGKFHAYAYGKHIVGDSSGNLYELTPTVNKYGSDAIVRDWISPHEMDGFARQRFSSFQVDCEIGAGLSTGFAPKLLLRYSNDNGQSWSSWREVSLGCVGRTRHRARSTMLGSGRDRVWNIRVTDDVQVNPIQVVVNEK